MRVTPLSVRSAVCTRFGVWLHAGPAGAALLLQPMLATNACNQCCNPRQSCLCQRSTGQRSTGAYKHRHAGSTADGHMRTSAASQGRASWHPSKGHRGGHGGRVCSSACWQPSHVRQDHTPAIKACPRCPPLHQAARSLDGGGSALSSRLCWAVALGHTMRASAHEG